MANELKVVRCCKNCEYGKQGDYFGIKVPWCIFKHKPIRQPYKRYTALLCMRYKKRRATDGE